MIQTDMDKWTDALSKCQLDKAVIPISRGYIVENVDSYNKIQKILNTPAMEHCHKFLYNLDVEDLQEDEISKIDELYQLGQDRGFIPLDEPDRADVPNDNDVCQAADMTISADVPVEEPVSVATAPLAAYTVMYSGMKDGQIKTGEAYSNAISPRSAKADVIAKLSKVGYDNISILAIEATDPDGVSTQPFQAQPNIGQVGTAISDDDSQIAEADKKDNVAAEEKQDDKLDEKPEDDADKSAEKTDNNKELSSSEKQTLRDAYKTAFKEAMLACEFDGMKFDDLTLEQKIQLLTKLDDEKWSGKPDPTEFMEKDDTDKLYSTVMKG